MRAKKLTPEEIEKMQTLNDSISYKLFDDATNKIFLKENLNLAVENAIEESGADKVIEILEKFKPTIH